MHYNHTQQLRGISLWSRNNPEELVLPMGDSPEWLPLGWITEIRTRKSGSSAGSHDKYYTNPTTGDKFRSKGEVLRYLESGTPYNHTQQLRGISLWSGNNPKELILPMEGSPEWLPSGWITEIRTRKSGSSAGSHDKYYTDPETGCKFRSKPDVFHYLETGELGKCVSRPKKLSIDDEAQSLQNKVSAPDARKRQKLAGSTARRSLFGNRGLNCDEMAAEQPNGSLLQEQCLALTSDKKHCQVGEGAGPSNISPPNAEPKRRQGSRRVGAKDHLGTGSSEDKKPSRNGVPSKLRENIIESALLLELEDKQLLAIQMSPESEYKKPAENGMLLLQAEHENQSDNGVQSEAVTLQNGLPQLEVEDKNQSDNGVPSESEDKKGTANGLPPMEDKQSDKGLPSESEEGKSLENGMLPGSEDKQSENGVPLELEMKSLPENGAENQKIESARTCSRKRKDKEATRFPRRASKRLAGIEPEGPPVFMNLDRVYRPTAKQQAHHEADDQPGGWARWASDQLDKLEANPEVESILHASKKTAQEGQTEKLEEEKLADEKSVSALVYPFGDSWPDPCLEFAFKTLTGVIPVGEEDTLAIQDYFQKQIVMGQTKSRVSSGCGLEKESKECQKGKVKH
ncbi:uncharacterized protein LOC143857913 isoform X1 [Tasmannia lanceolata]|uniref:uncharacterized protein LOC143857913 isoform X1 n=2 Tax=Tasmannia lanceolata TaxID=3420 RepID=UPI004062BF22